MSPRGRHARYVREEPDAQRLDRNCAELRCADPGEPADAPRVGLRRAQTG